MGWLVDFKRDDIFKIVPRDFEKQMNLLTGRDWTLEFEKGPGFTAVTGTGFTVGCGGIVPLWLGVGEAWLYLSDYISSHPIEIYKLIKQGFNRLLTEHKFYRVHTMINAELKPNRSLVEHLGFEPESFHRRYGPEGATYVMYACVAPEGECLQHF